MVLSAHVSLPNHIIRCTWTIFLNISFDPVPSTLLAAGGDKASGTLDFAAGAVDAANDVQKDAVDIFVQKTDNDLRLLDLKIERADLENDLKVIGMEINAARYNLDTAKAEFELVLKEEEMLSETKDYLRSKFTNIELYGWMSRELKKLLKVSYGHALSAAKMAERALQYELPTDDTFISTYWSNERNGLLAAEMLMADLNQMSLHHLRNDSRFQEIERKFSLRREVLKVQAGDSFADALDNMQLTFNLGELLYDMDYPGHYFRIIKTVALSIKTGSQIIDKTVMLPRMTLIQVGNKVVTQPDFAAVESLLGDESGDDEIDPNVIRVDWRSQQVATMSKWEEDNGMFVTNFLFDDRYFPFEGTGAVSSWMLELGESLNENQVNLETILQDPESDIIMTVKYSSTLDRGGFLDKVKKKVSDILSNN